MYGSMKKANYNCLYEYEDFVAFVVCMFDYATREAERFTKKSIRKNDQNCSECTT